MIQDPFDSPAALEAHFRARGFVDQHGIAHQSDRELFSKVLVPAGEPEFLLSAHILTGEKIGALEVGHQAIFDETQRAVAHAELARVVGDLFEASERRGACAFVAETLERGEEREQEFGEVRLQVLFPEREPEQDFELIYVEASRTLEPGEWEEWSGAGPVLDAAITSETRSAEAEAACHAILEARGHPFASGPLSRRMSSVMGEDQLDMLRGPDGASLWLTTKPTGERRLAVVHDDGRREEF